jgi:protein-export membrane protein SecD
MLHFANWKIATVLAVSLAGLLFAMPNMFSSEMRARFPSLLPNQAVNLGLDLRGGSHLLLEVETGVVIKERLEAVIDDVRSNLREQRIRYTGLRADKQAVMVRITDPERLDEAIALLENLAAPVTNGVLGGVATVDLVIEVLDENLISIALTESAIEQRILSAVDQSIEIVRRRIDELGTTEPTIQRQGSERILIQVPGFDDPARLKTLLGQTAKMSFRLVDVTARTEAPPAGTDVIYDESNPPRPYVLRRRVVVSGENLVDAQPGFEQQTNEPIVTFRFDATGARRFGQVTQENVGRPFAIVLDNKVISAPVIREAILGGTGQISGGFSVEEANDLAILLRAGALPAPLIILEERTVGPGLGADSIAAGEMAAIIGLLIVIGFMIVSYGLFGVFSDIALMINIGLILGILSLLQATLTLPGIAGIVLTIGMAVDANVLIYERIREEVRQGKSPISAIEAGYKRALGTILDANITTFIAAVILFQMGSGPVRGFAVTLAIGIVTSVFTAFTVTRLMVSVWIRRRRPGAVPL